MIRILITSLNSLLLVFAITLLSVLIWPLDSVVTVAVAVAFKPPAKHLELEFVARGLGYTGPSDKGFKNRLVLEGYSLMESIDDSKTGLQAMVIKDNKTGQTTIVFRGTEPSDRGDVISDSDASGDIGSSQYDKHKDTLKVWAEKYPGSDVTGHSLGAALGQRFVAENTDKVKEAVFFNAPGIGKVHAHKFALKDNKPPVTIYVGRSGKTGDADLVSENGGSSHLPSTVVEVENPFTNHAETHSFMMIAGSDNTFDLLDYTEYQNRRVGSTAVLKEFVKDPEFDFLNAVGRMGDLLYLGFGDTSAGKSILNTVGLGDREAVDTVREFIGGYIGEGRGNPEYATDVMVEAGKNVPLPPGELGFDYEAEQEPAPNGTEAVSQDIIPPSGEPGLYYDSGTEILSEPGMGAIYPMVQDVVPVPSEPGDEEWGERQDGEIIFEEVDPGARAAAQQDIDNDKARDSSEDHSRIAVGQQGYNAVHQDYLADEKARQEAMQGLYQGLAEAQQQINQMNPPKQYASPQPSAPSPEASSPYPVYNQPKPAWMTGGGTAQQPSPPNQGRKHAWTEPKGWAYDFNAQVRDNPCAEPKRQCAIAGFKIKDSNARLRSLKNCKAELKQCNQKLCPGPSDAKSALYDAVRWNKIRCNYKFIR